MLKHFFLSLGNEKLSHSFMWGPTTEYVEISAEKKCQEKNSKINEYD